jgi:hypothetical protein
MPGRHLATLVAVTDPSWRPDPTGRAHYRWWDGTQWTDSVSTDGVVSTDELVRAVPVAPTPEPQPAWNPAPPAGVAPVVPVVEGAKGKGNPLRWILPIAAVALVGAGLFFFLGRSDGDDEGTGFGVTEGEIVAGAEPTVVRVAVKEGEAIRIRLEPGDGDVDTKVLVMADNDTAEAFAERLFEISTTSDNDLFTDADQILDELFTDGDDFSTEAEFGDLEDLVILEVIDPGGEGDADADFVPALADGTLVLVPLANEDTETSYRLIVEKFDGVLDLDDDLSDLEQFTSDEEFFTDGDFFNDDGSFEPDE